MGSFCRNILLFSTMPCHQMPLLAYFRDSDSNNNNNNNNDNDNNNIRQGQRWS